MAEHTPTPWASLNHWPHKIVQISQREKLLGASIYELDDRERYAVIIATAESNEFTGFAHEIPADTQKSNAAFIVKAVNSHYAMVRALEEIAAMDPKGIRADDLGRAARIASDTLRAVVGSVGSSGK